MGLRQGGPLSTFLFNVVVHVLSRLIDKAKRVSIAKGLLVGKNKFEVSHFNFLTIHCFYKMLKHLTYYGF